MHMAQLMPLPLTVSCFSKTQMVLPYWYRLTRLVPDKGPLSGCVHVCIYFVDLFSCIAVSLFNKLTYLLTNAIRKEFRRPWRERVTSTSIAAGIGIERGRLARSKRTWLAWSLPHRRLDAWPSWSLAWHWSASATWSQATSLYSVAQNKPDYLTLQANLLKFA